MLTFAKILQSRNSLKQLVLSILCVLFLLLSSGCTNADARTRITVWSWEPSMKRIAKEFERLNPDLRVVVKDTSGYSNLNSAIQDLSLIHI